jgi:hypothetical protein
VRRLPGNAYALETQVDTRQKIISTDRLRSLIHGAPWTVIIGEFDPVNATVAERLSEWKAPGRKLLVVVKPGADPLIAPEGRAMLLAALRMVDAVLVETDSGWRELFQGTTDLEVREDTEFDQQTRSDFEALVVRRQQATGK